LMKSNQFFTHSFKLIAQFSNFFLQNVARFVKIRSKSWKFDLKSI
jgi:hypothetical protein